MYILDTPAEKSHIVRIDIGRMPQKIRAFVLERYDFWEFHRGVDLRLFANLLYDIAVDLWVEGKQMSFTLDVGGQKGAIVFDVGRSAVVKVQYTGDGWTESFEERCDYWGAFLYSCKVCMQKLLGR